MNFAAVATFLLVFSSLQVHAASKICKIEGDKAVKIASQKYYSYLIEPHDPDTNCDVNWSGGILTVSAGDRAAAKCTFQIFVPADNSANTIMIGATLKKVSDSSLTYATPNTSGHLAIDLSADKGATEQYRIISVDVPSLKDGCDAAKLGDKL